MNLLLSRLLVYSLAHLGMVFIYWKQWEWMTYFLCAGMIVSILVRWSDKVDVLYKTLMLEKKSFIVDWYPPVVILPLAVFVALQNEWNAVAGITAVYWVSSTEAMIRLNKWKKTME